MRATQFPICSSWKIGTVESATGHNTMHKDRNYHNIKRKLPRQRLPNESAREGGGRGLTTFSICSTYLED